MRWTVLLWAALPLLLLLALWWSARDAWGRTLEDWTGESEFRQRTRGVTTFVGTGQPGFQDGPAAEACLHEPAGVSAAGDSLYVADTNNHSIRVVGLATREVRTLELRGLER